MVEDLFSGRFLKRPAERQSRALKPAAKPTKLLPRTPRNSEPAVDTGFGRIASGFP